MNLTNIFLYIRAGDKVCDLEREEKQKGLKIASLLSRVATLQITADELEKRLQAETAKMEPFSVFHETFNQTGNKFVQEFGRHRRQVEKLESELSGLRESHATSILSHFIALHTALNKTADADLPPSPRPSSAESSASCGPPQAESHVATDPGSSTDMAASCFGGHAPHDA